MATAEANVDGTAADVKLNRLQRDNPSVKASDFRNDLVFWYREESRETVEPWLTNDNVVGIGDTAIGAEGSYESFAAWLAASSDRSIEIKELTAEGNEINKEITLAKGGTVTLNNINPRHVTRMSNGNDSEDYVESGKAGGIHREIENYKIVYKVRDGNSVYVAERNVKLRYKPGDLSMDGAINSTDAGSIISDYLGTYIFVNEDESKNTELCLNIADLTEDGAINSTDAGTVVTIYLEDSDGSYYDSLKLRY